MNLKQPIWIYGVHSCMEALANPDRIIYEARCTSKNLKEKIQSIRQIPVMVVDEQSLNRITKGVHQGIALCCEPKRIYKKIEPELFQNVTHVLVLDHLQDIGNIGSIMRSMITIGFPIMITAQKGVPHLESVAIKSSSGALEHVTIFQIPNIRDALLKLKDLDFFCVGLDHNGTKESLSLIKKHPKIALVIGSEGQGIQNIVKKECDTLLALNTNEHFGVLNASIATAIGMYIIKN